MREDKTRSDFTLLFDLSSALFLVVYLAGLATVSKWIFNLLRKVRDWLESDRVAQ